MPKRWIIQAVNVLPAYGIAYLMYTFVFSQKSLCIKGIQIYETLSTFNFSTIKILLKNHLNFEVLLNANITKYWLKCILKILNEFRLFNFRPRLPFDWAAGLLNHRIHVVRSFNLNRYSSLLTIQIIYFI